MPQLNPFPHDSGGGLGPSDSAKGWHAGYVAGVSSPEELPRTPSVRSTQFMDAFGQGAEAGRADGLAEGWRWRWFGEDARTGRAGTAGPRPPRSPAPPVDAEEDGPAAPQYPLAWRGVGELALGTMLEQFAPAAAGRDFVGLRLDRSCADKGVTRLYLPVRLIADEPPAEPTGDPLGDAGFWHGTVGDSFAEAAAELSGAAVERPGRVTRAAGFLALVRWSPAGEHDFWDVLPAGGSMPPRSH
ncbi:hypothetical protein [Kitasatospora herbaricolor]|uniref:Uncharacterized protein n=1 Tax=Kitasatospora herbaricolor TaxID=68217 RepID=A0ABZ1WK54_9ACTN|nr:hypothetical protein [Kitasatospora herbaricolor]